MRGEAARGAVGLGAGQSISHLLIREWRVEVPKKVKKVKKILETIDSVARGRASSPATFSICARKIRNAIAQIHRGLRRFLLPANYPPSRKATARQARIDAKKKCRSRLQRCPARNAS